MTKNEKPSAEASKSEAIKGEVEQPVEQAEVKAGKSKGMLKYILFGIGGIGLLAAAMFATLFFMGGKKAPSVKPDAPQELAQRIKEHAKEPKTTDSTAASLSTPEDSLQELADSADQIDQLVKNIEVMNQAADSEAVRAANAMPAEDSLKAMTWLDQQKADLSKREKDLAEREKKLETLNKDVSAKTLKLAQASSDRIANLAKLYDGMDSDAVAKLVANLDDSLVVAVLPRMKQKNASQLLGLMPPQRAAKISKEMITLAGE